MTNVAFAGRRRAGRGADQPGDQPGSTADAVDTQRGLRISILVLLFAEAIGAVVAWQLWALGGDRAGFAGLGLTMAAVTTVPLALRRHRLFSMWGMVCFAITIGAAARGVVIAVNYPSEEFVNGFFLGGQTFPELFNDGLVALATVVALTGGYLLAFYRRQNLSPKPASKWQLSINKHSEALVIAVATIYAGIGALATIGYWVGVGGLNASLLARRGKVTDSSSATFGYFTVLAQAGAIAVIILLAYWCATRRRFGVGRTLLLAAVSADALALSLLTTQRADVLYLALACIAVVAIVKQRVPVAMVVGVGLLVLLAIGGLTASRTATDDGNGLSIQYGINSGLLNRNAYDLGKTLRVIHAVPDGLPLQYGRTITIYLFAPVPRAIWHEKPVISPGMDIGQTVYGNVNSGVPPGMSGELVWNFGRAAAILLSFAIGLILGWIERRWGPHDPSRVTTVIFYVIVIFPLGKNIIGVSIGNAVLTTVGSVLLLIPLVLLTRLASGSDAEERSNSARKTRVLRGS